MASAPTPYRMKFYERELVTIFAKVSVASGAYTLVTTGGASRGVASVTKQGTGHLRITLDEKWAELREVRVTQVGASQLALDVNVEADAVLASNYFDIKWQNDAEGDTDPADGSQLIAIVLRNTNEA